MLKILNIVGARPQIIKASAICRTIKTKFAEQIEDIVVHTGQHYDWKMSEVFFNELEITVPKYNLNVGSASHGVQTAEMIKGIEEIIVKEKPDCVLLYGDTNSTLAGAVAAAKIHVQVAHVEAGLRSFNKSMPEEINRIMCDHASTLLFSPTQTGIDNLKNEGFKINNAPYHLDNPGIFHCGDVMYDNSIFFDTLAAQKSTFISDHKLKENEYILATIHRDNNTDIPERLQGIFTALDSISRLNNIEVILPMHPRTTKVLKENLGLIYSQIENNKLIKIAPPASFFDMIELEKHARLVMTDSGGVQKEAFFFKKPCVILRDQTEWTELVSCGAAVLAGADTEKIISAYDSLTHSKIQYPSIFGDGKAAEFICEKIIENFRKK